MNTQWKFALAVMLASSTFVAYAEDAPNADATVTSVAMPASVNNPAMHAQMQKMQAIYDQAAAAKSPAERQAAMHESMQIMQDSLSMMSQQQAAAGCNGMGMHVGSGMGMSGNKSVQGMGASDGMGMMGMMMKMLDQQMSMTTMPMHN
jgi:hypothetical protein